MDAAEAFPACHAAALGDADVAAGDASTVSARGSSGERYNPDRVRFAAAPAEFGAELGRSALAPGRLIGLIEAIGAIEKLPALFTEPHLDAVLVGPGELAVSMGLPRGSCDPAITERVLDLLRPAKQAGRSAGGPVFRTDLSLLRGAGGNLLMYSSDRLLGDGIAAAFSDIKASQDCSA
jgi:2-keto-3-deoxy-L-rhamnonate aldolase RhmA